MTIEGVLETCLYATDLAAAERFYGELLELPVFAREPGRHVFFRCGAAMLLVFDAARTASAAGEVNGVSIPPHGARGAGHVCFRVPEADFPAWRERLAAARIPIEAEVRWPRGGASLYVRDPAGNSVEFAPGRIWGLADVPAAVVRAPIEPPRPNSAMHVGNGVLSIFGAACTSLFENRVFSTAGLISFAVWNPLIAICLLLNRHFT